MFPREERQIGRLRLADTLRAVISQQLLSRKEDKGRVAAMEILIATPEVRSTIRDSQRLGDLEEMIENGGAEGMCSLQQHLADLVEKGIVSSETARAAVPESDNLPSSAEGKSRKKARG
jgi:twitching motility protein PilT